MTACQSTVAISFRELEPADLAQLNAWRNDKTIIDLLGNNFLYIASAVDHAWYQTYLANRQSQVRLAIIASDTNEYIGNVNLTHIHPINASAEFSILIGNQAYWGKGVGLQATRHMVDFGFNHLNLHRIYLTVLKENVRAIRLYEKAGFQVEGCQHQAVFKNNHYHDMLMMAILKSSQR